MPYRPASWITLLLTSGGLVWAGAGHRATAAAEPAKAELLASGVAPADVERTRYVDYVRRCADLLIAHGTDRYGTVRSPVLMNILDVRTRTSPENPLPMDEAYRVLRRDRRGPAGGNLYPDQELLRVFYRLSELTGDKRYGQFAAACIDYNLTHLVDERGLFWWGWHRHYDAYRDVLTGHQGQPHEIHIQRIIWPELWQVQPAAVQREIDAIWQWHVVDKARGEVNRHADGQRGCDFAMSGGEILRGFAFLYHQTRQPHWAQRARLVADYYWTARHPETSLIPNRPNAGRQRFDGAHFDTSITAFLCPCLLDAAEWTGDAVLREQAVTYLKAYAKYGFEAAGGGFWGSLTLDGQAVPGPRAVGGYAQYEPRGLIDLWQPYAAGYEHPVATALAYADAAQRTGDAELLTAAKRWAVFLRRGWPPRACEARSWYAGYARDWAPHGTYAGNYGQLITFSLQLHQLTGDAEHRDFARQVAREAVSRLYYDGLFRGHPAKPYYESMDGVGDLLGALLLLEDGSRPERGGIDRGRIP